MPLYEYECKACGHRFEKIQSFSAPDEKECPQCRGPVERLISAPAIQFKGAGWYVNDYAGRGKAPQSSASKEGGAKDNASKSGTEGKSAAGGDAGSSNSSGGNSSSGTNSGSTSSTSS